MSFPASQNFHKQHDQNHRVSPPKSVGVGAKTAWNPRQRHPRWIAAGCEPVEHRAGRQRDGFDPGVYDYTFSDSCLVKHIWLKFRLLILNLEIFRILSDF